MADMRFRTGVSKLLHTKWTKVNVADQWRIQKVDGKPEYFASPHPKLMNWSLQSVFRPRPHRILVESRYLWVDIYDI